MGMGIGGQGEYLVGRCRNAFRAQGSPYDLRCGGDSGILGTEIILRSIAAQLGLAVDVAVRRVRVASVLEVGALP
jgi:hypothetical protein